MWGRSFLDNEGKYYKYELESPALPADPWTRVVRPLAARLASALSRKSAGAGPHQPCRRDEIS